MKSKRTAHFYTWKMQRLLEVFGILVACIMYSVGSLCVGAGTAFRFDFAQASPVWEWPVKLEYCISPGWLIVEKMKLRIKSQGIHKIAILLKEISHVYFLSVKFCGAFLWSFLYLISVCLELWILTFESPDHVKLTVKLIIVIPANVLWRLVKH